MASERPVLFFVSGPQKTRQFPLLDNVVIAGRGSTAKIPLTEEYVSREQLRFEFTTDGWVVENLSSSAQMCVNDRKFKPGKRILLETGDCILVGTKTRLLFVESGSGVEEAVNTYYQEHPDLIAKKRAAIKPQVSSEVAAAKPTPVAVAPPVLEKEKTPEDKPLRFEHEQLTPDQIEESNRRNKIRKYVIGGGVYLLLMILLIIGAIIFKKSDSGESTGRPPELTLDQIKDAISSDLSGSPNEIAAQAACDKARRFYDNRAADEQNLYFCVKNYRLFQALRPETKRAFKPQDEINFDKAKKALTEKIKVAYENALNYEKGKNWIKAMAAFDYVLRIVPPNKEDPEVEKVIIGNIRKHVKYVGNMLKKQKKRK